MLKVVILGMLIIQTYFRLTRILSCTWWVVQGSGSYVGSSVASGYVDSDVA
jgi:hypothetical protein